MINKDNRLEFEAHFKHLDLTQEPDAWGVPRYKHDAISLAWQAWQAARRAQVVAVPQEALALLRWAEFLLATSAPMTSQQKEAWPSLQKAADEMRAYQASMLAAAPQPPEVQP